MMTPVEKHKRHAECSRIVADMAELEGVSEYLVATRLAAASVILDALDDAELFATIARVKMIGLPTGAGDNDLGVR